MHPHDTPATPSRVALGSFLVGLVALGWAYLPTLRFLLDRWLGDPQYSHGFLVPVFSGYLLYRASQAGRLSFGRPLPAVALAVLAVASAARVLAGGWMFHQLDCVTLLASVAGLTLALGGWRLLRVASPAIGFLVFAVPLPYELERNVGGPLKKFSTDATTYLLQTVGQPAIAEGNQILIDDVKLGVVDACSGLKMLVTFSAFAAGAVLTLGRTRFENVLIALGVVPIAVLTNVLRITATGIAYTVSSDKETLDFLHDLHGWLMMPVGLGLLGVQLWCLTRLVEAPAPRPAVAGMRFA